MSSVFPLVTATDESPSRAGGSYPASTSKTYVLSVCIKTAFFFQLGALVSAEVSPVLKQCFLNWLTSVSGGAEPTTLLTPTLKDELRKTAGLCSLLLFFSHLFYSVWNNR